MTAINTSFLNVSDAISILHMLSDVHAEPDWQHRSRRD